MDSVHVTLATGSKQPDLSDLDTADFELPDASNGKVVLKLTKVKHAKDAALRGFLRQNLPSVD